MASIRDSVIASEKKEVARLDRLEARASVSACELTSEDLDAAHAAKPFRDRLPLMAHFYPSSLLATGAKCGVLRGLLLVVSPEEPAWPPLQPAPVLAFATAQLTQPVLKDIASTTVLRALERVAETHFSGAQADEEEGLSRGSSSREFRMGRWTRDPGYAARDASDVVLSHGGSSWNASFRAATHVALHVMPRPSILLNTSLLIVDIGELTLKSLYRIARREYAQYRLRALPQDDSSAEERASLHRELFLINNERRGWGAATAATGAAGGAIAAGGASSTAIAVPLREGASSFPAAVLLTTVNACGAVVAECVLGGLLTLFLPGWGTWVGQGLGGVLAWSV